MRENESTDRADVRFLPPFAYLAGLIAGYALWWFWPVPVAPAAWGVAIRILGGVVVLAGFALDLWAFLVFRSAGEDPNPMRATGALTFSGPYRFTRNPMYLGLALIHSGLALLGNALWPLLALVPVIWIVRTQVIDKEERYLETKFGVPYREYKAKVRRWL
jgi:protein-S-isoprenylcysteine O-methyltransferase Ste14